MNSAADFTLTTAVIPCRVRIATLHRMQSVIEKGGRVLWDYQGLVREIPAAVIENAVQLAEDYASRPAAPNRDSAPKFSLSLMWEQTVSLEEGRQLRDQGTEPAADSGGPADQ